MLLTEEEIKFANDLIESDSADIANVDSKIGKPAKRCPDCDKEPCECETNESEDEEIAGIESFSAQEIEEILRTLSQDEVAFLKEVIQENLEDFCPEFQAAFAEARDIEALVKIAKECCPEDLELYGECVAFVMDEIDDFSDFAYADTLGAISERLINPQHIRRLKLQKRKAAWKADARKRARFRKTGEGRMMKRKAKLYMKKYRRRKKARLKRYGKEYSKFTANMGGK